MMGIWHRGTGRSTFGGARYGSILDVPTCLCVPVLAALAQQRVIARAQEDEKYTCTSADSPSGLSTAIKDHLEAGHPSLRCASLKYRYSAAGGPCDPSATLRTIWSLFAVDRPLELESCASTTHLTYTRRALSTAFPPDLSETAPNTSSCRCEPWTATGRMLARGSSASCLASSTPSPEE
jgi:hypothetical protein